MSHPRVGRAASNLAIERTRARKTARPVNAFKEVLKGGASVLLSGARVATKVVGLPALSAAVSGKGALSRGSSGVGLARAQLRLDSAVDQGVAGNAPSQALGDQRLGEDLQLLALQEQIQRHNRQIALLSNVMKARHDTAKAAIANMRS